MPEIRIEVTDEDAERGFKDVDIEVWCGTCGAGICHLASPSGRRGRDGISVEVCSDCENTAKEKGHSEGYDEAETDAQAKIAGLEDDLDQKTRRIHELEEQLERLEKKVSDYGWGESARHARNTGGNL